MPRQFARFCSGALAGPENGFDRWIYLTNEESDGASTFDGRGGVSVAIFDDEPHTLPRLGRFSKENTVVQPGHGTRTVIFSLEDGPATLDNQLYMYVGTKDRSAGASALARNGLDNGKLYVFRSLDPAHSSERTFTSASVRGEWVEIEDADTLTDAELGAASDAVGAMTFVRPEDGAFNPNNPNEFFFDTTGSLFGRCRRRGERTRAALLDQAPPGRPARAGHAHGRVQRRRDRRLGRRHRHQPGQHRDERPVPHDQRRRNGGEQARDGLEGARWIRLALRPRQGPGRRPGHRRLDATRVAELDPPGRDGVPVGAGIWETSGIIDASALFGGDTWLSDVQAHAPTAAPGGSTVTVEDGQLFLMRRGG
jgi:hypothetical protein